MKHNIQKWNTKYVLKQFFMLQFAKHQKKQVTKSNPKHLLGNPELIDRVGITQSTLCFKKTCRIHIKWSIVGTYITVQHSFENTIKISTSIHLHKETNKPKLRAFQFQGASKHHVLILTSKVISFFVNAIVSSLLLFYIFVNYTQIKKHYTCINLY